MERKALAATVSRLLDYDRRLDSVQLLAGRNSGGRSLVLLACRYDGGPTRETYPDNVFLLTNKYYLGYILLLTITEALVLVHWLLSRKIRTSGGGTARSAS